MVGGAAVTEEFYPGFRDSDVEDTESLSNPQVLKGIGLEMPDMEHC